MTSKPRKLRQYECPECHSTSLYLVCDCGYSERLDGPKSRAIQVLPITASNGPDRHGKAAGRDAKKHDAIKWIMVLDIETTGVSPGIDHIIELGICKIYLDTGTVEPVFNQIFKPMSDFDRKAWVFHNSTLTVDDVLKAQPLAKYHAKIQNILKNNIVTAFNKDFDFSFLRAAGFSIKRQAPCIMHQATGTCKISHPYYEFKWPKIEEVWSYYFPRRYIEAHRALDDAMHEAMLLHEMFKRGDYPLNILGGNHEHETRA